MSDSFWKKIKNLFTSVEQSSALQPTIHEIIERTEAEKADYETWKNSLSARRILDWIRGEYITYLSTPDNVDTSVDFLNTPSSKGFVIHFHRTNYNRTEITHLFDFFKEKVKTLPYRTYVSDTRTYPKNTWVETIQRHYLKPSLRLKTTGQKAKQAFGNINIELLLRNDQVVNLKFSATSYRDHQFEEAEDFGQLMKELFV